MARDESWTQPAPDLIIHCAALSKSALCENDPEMAWKSNVELTRRLCEFASGTALIFFSTDLVFDGRKGNYSETDAVNPLTAYGRTKAEAERIVLANPRHTVIRLALNVRAKQIPAPDDDCSVWQVPRHTCYVPSRIVRLSGPVSRYRRTS